MGGDYKWLIDGGRGGINLDARSYFIYLATVNTPAMVLKIVGKGSQYTGADKTKDGSVDIYFGPKPPAGKESNWVETVPGKGWFVVLRLYGPLDSWFDNEWRPGEIELLGE